MESPSDCRGLFCGDTESVSVEGRNFGIFSNFAQDTWVSADACSADWMKGRSTARGSGPTSSPRSGRTALAARPTASRGLIIPRPVHSPAH